MFEFGKFAQTKAKSRGERIYDNALAETINGLYKTEVIRNRNRGPWKKIDDLEYATLECVDWFNNRHLLEPIGNILTVEYEIQYYERIEGSVMVA